MFVHKSTGLKLKKTTVTSKLAQKAKAVKETVNLKRVNVRSFIESSCGKIMSVKFTKLDGSTRKLVGRVGVTSYLKGGSNKVEANDRPYITLFEIQASQYRTINLDTVCEIRALGKIWRIID